MPGRGSNLLLCEHPWLYVDKACMTAAQVRMGMCTLAGKGQLPASATRTQHVPSHLTASAAACCHRMLLVTAGLTAP